MARHAIYEVFDHQKNDLLLHLLNAQEELSQVLVVLRTREGVHALSTALANVGIAVDSVHGKKKSELIERALSDLKSGKVQVLVVTDASARNIDLTGVPAIIQVDMPELVSDYQARLGLVEKLENGVFYSFENPHNANVLAKVEELLGEEIARERAEGFAYETQALRTKQTRNKTPKRGPRSKPLQHKKKKWKPKKYTR
ncbi:helicase-related protein [Rubritalea spongiae]|uniref:Helicase-related protein n=1 Tax=Rubritalea spongiae TaxID=430797 RepID=A0ABW5E174_9BACT